MAIYILQSGKKLNKSHFIRYVEKKVFSAVRKYELIGKKDKIVVACSGGKDSNVCLYILTKLCKPRKQKLEALAIDEGIPGYRNILLEKLKKFCKELEIPLHIFSFYEEYGIELKKIIKKIKELGLSNCYVCSILKRWLLNKKAKELGFSKVATGHSLDDEAENILLNQFKGNMSLSGKLGPLVGVMNAKKLGFVQRIKPLYFLTTKEITLYAKLRKIPCSLKICPLREETFRVEIRKWLGKMEKKYPNIKNCIVHSLLYILPLLKKKQMLRVVKCRVCGEVSNTGLCKKCELLEELGVRK